MKDSPVHPRIYFDVWGCRGSHNIVPARSRVGNNTACYSLLRGEDLYVLDAGRGLLVLGHAMTQDVRFQHVRNIHVLISHAHLDHWEGLKDVEWFWRRDNGLHLSVYGTEQAIGAIRRGYSHPAYVALDILAMGTAASLRFEVLKKGEQRRLGALDVGTFSLNHYSGGSGNRVRRLDTLGFRLATPEGVVVAYLSDHEPTPRTARGERGVLAGSHLALYDAHFAELREHRFGHGSQEHAAGMARQHEGTLVLAGHHGPMYTDDALFENHQRHSHGAPNFELALEETGYTWNPERGQFERA